MYKYDFICLSETYLDSTAPDNLLEIDGYNLVCVDHPNNIKRGGVCIYYKESLPVRVISLPHLKEALVLETNHDNKKMIVSAIYRSSSQNNRAFDSFLLNFEQLLSDIGTRKPTVSIITGNFNATSSSWGPDDINISEGTNLYSLTSSNGLFQLINELTQVQSNSFSHITYITYFSFILKYKQYKYIFQVSLISHIRKIWLE